MWKTLILAASPAVANVAPLQVIDTLARLPRARSCVPLVETEHGDREVVEIDFAEIEIKNETEISKTCISIVCVCVDVAV